MSKCPISRSDFLSSAEDLLALVNDTPVELRPKEFSTGSFGWNGSKRLKVSVGDIPLTVQLSTNATVLKSKEAPAVSTKEKATSKRKIIFFILS